MTQHIKDRVELFLLCLRDRKDFMTQDSPGASGCLWDCCNFIVKSHISVKQSVVTSLANCDLRMLMKIDHYQT